MQELDEKILSLLPYIKKFVEQTDAAQWQSSLEVAGTKSVNESSSNQLHSS